MMVRRWRRSRVVGFNWTCPHCDKSQTVVAGRNSQKAEPVGVETIEGTVVLERTAISCSKPDCQKLTLSIRVGADAGRPEAWIPDSKKILVAERVIPRGASKPQPDFIPEVLRADYYEACLIRGLSPKASAILSRRCLQGMIRNFAGIAKATLALEIHALKKAVADGSADRAISAETVEAIDHVRGLGNIGAHMEKDIDVIVPVDPDEAQHMIDLIEMLFEEWYGARERRTQKLSTIARLGSAKKEALLAARGQRGAGEAEAGVAQEVPATPREGSEKSLEERLLHPGRAVSDGPAPSQ